ncbi:hypothetical protein BC567DRAFT_216304 [Phyllosticta citribraziliensis]
MPLGQWRRLHVSEMVLAIHGNRHEEGLDKAQLRSVRSVHLLLRTVRGQQLDPHNLVDSPCLGPSPITERSMMDILVLNHPYLAPLSVFFRTSGRLTSNTPISPEPLPSGPSQSPIQSRGLRPGQQGRYRHRRHVRRNILPFFELDLDLEDLPSSLPSSRTTGVWRSVTTIEDNMECTDMDTLETHP